MSLRVCIIHCTPMTPHGILPLFRVMMFFRMFFSTSVFTYGSSVIPKASGSRLAVQVLLP